jgi:hypothetical protein
MINRGADMVAHGRDFNIISTVGTCDGGQETHIHCRHPSSDQKVGITGGCHRVSEGLTPYLHGRVALKEEGVRKAPNVWRCFSKEHNLGWSSGIDVVDLGVVRGRPEEEVYSGMFPEGKTQVVKQLELDLT